MYPIKEEQIKKRLSKEKLRVNDQLVEYEILIDEDNNLHLIPDYDKLRKIAPNGTVMEFLETELSIYPFKSN